ncbi:virulence factor [Campylobacter jejuni]|uniref:virulence factor n=1 Tax=Campylobacter jejuni TaxID=197 RepID=UPI000F80B1AF|nr:virulence factor [Campylobacter jejuni]ECO3391934.1 virulence factor [Campylobacter jejuni]EEA6200472.1 virulence factor [Campylobacter jejuni]RTJ63484.1 virulence factor [Campylobacter jejuni]HEF7505671.1 virulence factor [Campylobacter jejuni]HEG0426704.1 virulence factor [Campylobacter jejuni]
MTNEFKTFPNSRRKHTTNCLSDNNINHSKAYSDIRKFMEANGFKWQQGSVYFGNETINAVTCVATIQALAKTLPCFSICVKDVRMLKIEENNDLMPAVKAVL